MTTSETTRGPGRPRKDESERRQAERRRRKAGATTGGRLGCNPDLLDHSLYVYRWLNDEPGRVITKTRNDDWDLVPNLGEKEDSTDLGAMVSVVVGTLPDGSPKRSFLARKLKTFYDEDKAEEQRALDEQVEQLRRGAPRGEQHDYVPKTGIRM